MSNHDMQVARIETFSAYINVRLKICRLQRGAVANDSGLSDSMGDVPSHNATVST